MHVEQYKLISARRVALNGLIWQTPTLAIAGQSFLIATALNPNTATLIGVVLSLLSLLVGIASAQLLAKHRHHELADSVLLADFERSNLDYEVLHDPPHGNFRHRANWAVRRSSFRLWMGVLFLFCALALASIGLVAFGVTKKIQGADLASCETSDQPKLPIEAPASPRIDKEAPQKS